MSDFADQSRDREDAAAHPRAENPIPFDLQPRPRADGRGADPPYLTSALPGIGGTLKSEPEDFVVEEIPAYEPCGEGEHLFLWVQKHDVAAEELVRQIATSLGISRDDVGVAGLKDRRAITRQYVSVPAACEENVAAIETDAIRILAARRHGNKLRTGHLRGNRFEIVLRDVDQGSDSQTARQIANRIRQQGFPNYYGEQRFGAGGETFALGLDLLSGRKTPRDIPHRQRRFLLRLALSSVQSALFNAILSQRLRDEILQTVLVGDVMQKRETGGLFVAEDIAAEQRRLESGETVITGPMFGPKMRRPAGDAAKREADVLREHGLTPEHFAGWKRLLPGTRRPLLAFASGLSIEQTGNSLRLAFGLDRGVYATTLLREFQKPDLPTK